MTANRFTLYAATMTLLAATVLPHSWAQGSLFAREGTVWTGDVRLYYKSVGTGEAIVVLHGGPGINHSYFLPQLGTLARTYRLIFLDQRAHGRSTAPRDTNAITLKNFVDDLEALRRTLRLGPMNLMAHSWGSLVALSYAAQYPSSLKRLILINPIPASDSLNALAVQQHAARQTREDREELASLMRTSAFRQRTPASMDRYFRTVFRSTFHDPRYADSLTFFFPGDYASKSNKLKHLARDLDGYDLVPLLGAVTAPTLIVRGSDDPTPRPAMEIIRDAIPGASLAEIPRSGHFPFIEQREAFVNTVRTFLNTTR